MIFGGLSIGSATRRNLPARGSSPQGAWMASMTTRLPRPLLRGCRGGVVAAHPLAVTAGGPAPPARGEARGGGAPAGDDVLRAGGNAVDAAVAAAAALAVAAPDQCGLGGDALLLVREPDGAVA